MQQRLKLETSAEPPASASVIAVRAAIPADLTAAERQILRANLNHNCDGQAFFFRDLPEVRRALRMGYESRTVLRAGGERC
jgi:hypothetical protein